MMLLSCDRACNQLVLSARVVQPWFIYFNYSLLKASVFQELPRFTAPVLQPARDSAVVPGGAAPAWSGAVLVDLWT